MVIVGEETLEDLSLSSLNKLESPAPSLFSSWHIPGSASSSVLPVLFSPAPVSCYAGVLPLPVSAPLSF